MSAGLCAFERNYYFYYRVRRALSVEMDARRGVFGKTREDGSIHWEALDGGDAYAKPSVGRVPLLEWLFSLK